MFQYAQLIFAIFAVLGLVGPFLAGLVTGWRMRTRTGCRTAVAIGLAGAILPFSNFLWMYIGMVTYERTGPSDPGDSPMYALIASVVVSPFLWLIGLVLATLGYLAPKVVSRLRPRQK